MDADAVAAMKAGKPLYEARGGGPNAYPFGFILTPYMNTPGLVTGITRWCDEQFTILGWENHRGGFWFRKESHAFAFKMRWM